MVEVKSTDVERHLLELHAHLYEDGFEVDSVVMKTARRLQKALKDDGFLISDLPVGSVMVSKNTKAKPTALAAVVLEDPEPVTVEAGSELMLFTAVSQPESAVVAPVVSAFRVKDSFDASAVQSVFSTIDGWSTKVMAHQGSYFVFVVNAPTITVQNLKDALIAYYTELKTQTKAP